MKKNRFLLLVISFLLTFNSCKNDIKYEYKVKVIYCDARPPKIFYIESWDGANFNREINSYKLAVPKWRGEHNVCEVVILEKKISKN